LGKVLRLTTFLSLLILTFSCENNTNEIKPGREPLATRNTPLIPLPAPQRFGILPIEQENFSTPSPQIPQTQENLNPNLKPPIFEKLEENKQVGGFIDFNLTWSIPEGWVEATKKPMRIVTFNGGPNSHWECYITVISSQAGGIQANISRWAKQMGKVNIDDTDLSQLPEITILEKRCPLIEISGTYTDMGGGEYPNYKLIGTICPLDDKTIFIKMIGPETEVNAEKEKFIELCNSLKLKNAEK